MLSAPRDFCVGEAIRYVDRLGYRVVFKYERTAAPPEASIIDKLRQEGYLLINDCPGFDWKTPDETVERARINEFMSNAMQVVLKRCEKASSLASTS